MLACGPVRNAAGDRLPHQERAIERRPTRRAALKVLARRRRLREAIIVLGQIRRAAFRPPQDLLESALNPINDHASAQGGEMRNLIAGLLLGTIVLASLAAQSDTRPFTEGRSSCTPFDPATLQLVEVKRSETSWSLRRGDGAMLKTFATLEDAEAGIAVAKKYTQLCYIGKSNTRPDRERYIMEYWK